MYLHMFLSVAPSFLRNMTYEPWGTEDSDSGVREAVTWWYRTHQAVTWGDCVFGQLGVSKGER